MPTALITGASSGIGAAFARRLASEGWSLIVAARRRDRLEELAAAVPVDVRVVEADLTTGSGIASVEAVAPDADMVVNNAGFGGYGPFASMEPAVAQDLITLHCVAPVRVSRAAIPSMIERGHGAVINVASLLAFSKSVPPDPLPHRAVYAAAKAFLVTFTSQLALELAGTGVRAMVVTPGLVEAEFHGPNWQGPPRMPAEDVVQACLRGFELGETICAPPLPDPALFARLEAAERDVLVTARMTQLAERYR